jgi:hypothetical protein
VPSSRGVRRPVVPAPCLLLPGTLPPPSGRYSRIAATAPPPLPATHLRRRRAAPVSTDLTYGVSIAVDPGSAAADPTGLHQPCCRYHPPLLPSLPSPTPASSSRSGSTKFSPPPNSPIFFPFPSYYTSLSCYI